MKETSPDFQIPKKLKSRITGGEIEPIFQKKILNKYPVTYYRCKETGFIQTDCPFWLEEAYSSAITAIDLGIVSRNFGNAQITQDVVAKLSPSPVKFLDYAGGYGLFTRLMRDRGYDFKHYDLFCENIFAKGFAIVSITEHASSPFDLTTGWEVMEHLPDPAGTVASILSVSGAFLFSTSLVPEASMTSVADWWYLAPETGQHISFYTRNSLECLATSNNSFLYSNNKNIHLISRARLARNPLLRQAPNLISRGLRWIARKIDSTSRFCKPQATLLDRDYELALSQLRMKQSHKSLE